MNLKDSIINLLFTTYPQNEEVGKTIGKKCFPFSFGDLAFYVSKRVFLKYQEGMYFRMRKWKG